MQLSSGSREREQAIGISSTCLPCSWQPVIHLVAADYTAAVHTLAFSVEMAASIQTLAAVLEEAAVEAQAALWTVVSHGGHRLHGFRGLGFLALKSGCQESPEFVVLNQKFWSLFAACSFRGACRRVLSHCAVFVFVRVPERCGVMSDSVFDSFSFEFLSIVEIVQFYISK